MTSHEIPKPGIGSRARRSGSYNWQVDTRYIPHTSPSNKPRKTAFKNGHRGKVRLYLHDECPRIGSGWRWLNICVGSKWVKVNAGRGFNTRISRQLFDRLHAGTQSIITRSNMQQTGVQL